MREILIDHISKELVPFICWESIEFDEIFQCLAHPSKDFYRPMLKYVNQIINQTVANDQQSTAAVCIQFEDAFGDQERILLAEFIVLKEFLSGALKDKMVGDTNKEIKQVVNELKMKQSRLRDCPEGAIGLKNKAGNKIFQQWKKEKSDNTFLLNFFEKVIQSKDYKPVCLFNSQTKLIKPLQEFFMLRPYGISISDLAKPGGYVLLNSDLGLLDIGDDYEELINNLKTIVLFDCDRKESLSSFNLDEIKKCNIESGTRFQKFIVVSFGTPESSFQSLQRKAAILSNRFKIPNSETYTILTSEMDQLLGRKTNNNVQPNFLGSRNGFWDTFKALTTELSLYELRSIKMREIYSLAFNMGIKQFIMDEIFLKDTSHGMLSADSKQLLLSLPVPKQLELRELLSSVIDHNLQVSMREFIADTITAQSVIVLPEFVQSNQILKSKVASALGVGNGNTIVGWSTLEVNSNRHLVILSYKDQGKYPYHFYPNITEPCFPSDRIIKSMFYSCFFRMQYDIAQSRMITNTYRYLQHNIRDSHFRWKLLKEKVYTFPKFEDDTPWDLESEYISINSREGIKIEYLTSGKQKKYAGSDLFIVKLNYQSSYNICRLDELIQIDLSEELLFVQNLEEIQHEINIYARILDSSRQEEDLTIIRDEFNIVGTSPGGIWKTLLKQKSDFFGEFQLFNELHQFLNNKKLSIVSLGYFRNNWINPKSEILTPLSNRVFVSICDFLGLPKIYMIIMHRIKNNSKQATRKSTRLMNNLLKELFDDGCFDGLVPAEVILEERLEIYRTKHPFDEIGINDDYLLGNLIALVELIEPEIQLKQVKNIHKC